MPKVRIRAVGTLRIDVAGREVSSRLHEQPRLEFLFSYVLAHSLSGGEAGIVRPGLADEVAPDLPVSSQLDRLRKQLYALQAALGPELRGLVQSNNSHVRLNLEGVDLDAAALRVSSRTLGRRHALIDAQLADEIRHLLDETAGGDFLAGFSELEQQVTAGRGSALQIVEEARTLVAGWRADLVHSLAEYHQAAGRPQASIAYLQAALAQTPQRQDLARLLVAAFVQTGQTKNADQTRLEYDLTKEA